MTGTETPGTELYLSWLSRQHPSALSETAVQRLTELRPTSALADRLLAHREKWLYDHPSRLPTRNPFSYADALAACYANRTNHWPKPGLRGALWNRGRTTFSGEFLNLITREQFQLALRWVELADPRQHATLQQLTAVRNGDGQFLYQHPEPKRLPAALGALMDEMWSVVQMDGGKSR